MSGFRLIEANKMSANRLERPSHQVGQVLLSSSDCGSLHYFAGPPFVQLFEGDLALRHLAIFERSNLLACLFAIFLLTIHNFTW